MKKEKSIAVTARACVLGVALVLLGSSVMARDLNGHEKIVTAHPLNRPDNPSEFTRLICVYEVEIWESKQVPRPTRRYEVEQIGGSSWCPSWHGTGKLVDSFYR